MPKEEHKEHFVDPEKLQTGQHTSEVTDLTSGAGEQDDISDGKISVFMFFFFKMG